ncbi:MAG: hypothetical protein ABSC64_19335 [Candidatus Korobacteraceae bacterium]|jgi:hypothetical protein
MPILDVKKAVELARGYLSDILQVPDYQVLLEEVEFSEDGKFWFITLSYPAPYVSSVQAVLGQHDRAYKVVKLRGSDGAFVAVKMRSLAEA